MFEDSQKDSLKSCKDPLFLRFDHLNAHSS